MDDTSDPMMLALSHTAQNETGRPFSAASANNDSPDAFHSTSSGSLGLNTHFGSRPPGWTHWSPEQKMGYERQYYSKIYHAVPGQLLSARIDPAIASHPGVVAYMSDRAIQMGNVGLPNALASARGASNPEDFLSKVSTYDMANLQSHFPHALAERPNIYQGLLNRIQKRHAFALGDQSSGGPVVPLTTGSGGAYGTPQAPPDGAAAATAPQQPTAAATRPEEDSEQMGLTESGQDATSGPAAPPDINIPQPIGQQIIRRAIRQSYDPRVTLMRSLASWVNPNPQNVGG